MYSNLNIEIRKKKLNLVLYFTPFEKKVRCKTAQRCKTALRCKSALFVNI